ncbi:MAG TPA: DUF2383 domain-containing protein [Gemmatimonadaceae bacterium]|nr:DUF2383 domain-containing protein [Gemmatimonadaceae bacterium]
MTYSETRPNEGVGQLNSLLRGEISAQETYHQAIEKLGTEGQSEVEVLREIAREHTGAVERLREAVRRAGGTPSEGSGVWGAFARAVEGAAKVAGNTAALKALKEGEEHGLKDYKEAVDDVDPATRQLIVADLIPAQQRHIQVLDSLLTSR